METRPCKFSFFFAIFIAVLAVIFAVQNNDPTNVQFAIWDFEGSVALVLLVALAAGAMISFFVSLPSSIRARWTIRQQRKKITEMETSLNRANEELDTVQKKLDLLQSPPSPEKPTVALNPVPEAIVPSIESTFQDQPGGELQKIE